MDSIQNDDVVHDFRPFFKVHRDGRIERYIADECVPPTADPDANVRSRDVVVSPESAVGARIFFPDDDGPDRKLPLILHFHGGGFCVGSAFDAVTSDNLTALAAKARAVAVSVDYRRAPENLLPAAYHDAFAALQWIAAHAGGSGPDPFLNARADFGRVFLMGESAGANIAHHVAVRAGVTPLANGFRILGLILVHPFFGGTDRDRIYRFLCPSSEGNDGDPNLNPGLDPNVRTMGCGRVLVCVAEKDWLREKGRVYYETLCKSGWVGSVELEETEGVDHCFHLFNPSCEKALALKEHLASYINRI